MRISKDTQVSLSDNQKTIGISNTSGSITILTDDIAMLMALLAQAIAKLGSKEATTVFPVQWWHVLPDAQFPENLLLHFRVSDNFQLAFRIHRDRGPEYIAAIQKVLAQPISLPSSTPH